MRGHRHFSVISDARQRIENRDSSGVLVGAPFGEKSADRLAQRRRASVTDPARPEINVTRHQSHTTTCDAITIGWRESLRLRIDVDHVVMIDQIHEIFLGERVPDVVPIPLPPTRRE